MVLGCAACDGAGYDVRGFVQEVCEHGGDLVGEFAGGREDEGEEA